MFDGPVGEAIGGGIVNLNRGRRMRVTHYGEIGANGHIFLSVDISGSNFGFGRIDWGAGAVVKAEVSRDRENEI